MQDVVQQVRQEGVDVNDPITFYRTVADKLQAAGKVQPAMQLSLKAAETEFLFNKRKAEVAKLDAEAAAKLREKESDVQTLLREARAAMSQGRVGEAEALIQKINVLNQPNVEKTIEGAGTTLIDGKSVPQVKEVVRDRDGKVLWEGKPYVKSGGQNVNVTNMPPQDDTGMKFLGTVAERQATEFNKQLSAANELRPAITDMEGLLKDPKMVTGSMPDIRLEAIRALNTAGLGTIDTLSQQNNSDLFDSYAINVILPKMRMLGGSDSNEELKKVSQSYANRKMDIAAIRRLVSAAKRDVEKLDRIDAAYNAGLSEGRNPVTFNWATGGWRNVKNMPNFMETPPGVRPVPGGQGATGSVTGAPTPPLAESTRMVTTSDIERYKAVMKAAGTDVSRYTDEQIKKVLERTK